MKEAKRELKKAQTIMQLDELKCRKRVLRRSALYHDNLSVEVFLMLTVCPSCLQTGIC